MADIFDCFMEHVLINYRWIFVILFLLPISFIYELWTFCRNYVVFKLNSAPKMHDSKVKYVQKQILDWKKSGGETKLCTARPGWQTMSFRRPVYKKTFTNICVEMVDILEIDQNNMTVRCEPLVTMGQLSRTLEQLNLALEVVPEIDDLTVGGLVMGTGIETSSHIYGLFQNICLEFELVLADGSVTICNKDKNQDLFYTIPWSHGTLGFLTSVVLKMVKAKKYVRMEYLPQTNKKQLVDNFIKESTNNEPHQFVECLVYNETSGVIMVADMIDEVNDDGVLNRIGDWDKPWFFKHVESILKSYKRGNRTRFIEYIPLRHYYHRHTRSLFWELQDIIPFGNNILFRKCLGWLMPPKVSLLKMTQTKVVKKLYEQRHVIQDMLVPIDRLADSLKLFHDTFEVYPIWLCPFKLPNEPGLLKLKGPYSNRNEMMFVDIGTYGVPKAKNFETVKSTRRIESYVIECNGYQMLYADTYTNRDEFRRMFDHTLYDKVRNNLTDCQKAFPEIYDKVSRTARE